MNPVVVAMKHQSKRRLQIFGSVFSILLFLAMAGFAYRWHQGSQAQAHNKILAEIYQKGMYAADRPVLLFSNKVFDFGTIAAGKIVEHTYQFTNMGGSPLIIHQVLGGCCNDCMTTIWPKQPIQAGERGEIEVRLNNTDHTGEQNNVIVVSANTDPAETKLLFKGVVGSSNKK